MKPMLASDANPDKIKFPCMIQPKIDGVRAMNITGKLTGRSLKQHKNRFTNTFFNSFIFEGFDGEMFVNQDPTHPDLCRTTSSVLGTYEGEPFITWNIFDYVTDETKDLSYVTRLKMALNKVLHIKEQYPLLKEHLQVSPVIVVWDIDELTMWEQSWLMQGYEGLIIRDPDGKYKHGRSTAKEGGLLRIKRFIDAEATVIGITEGEENNNEKQVNELGNSFRSSHKENKIGNGMVGNLICRIKEDIYDSNNELLFEKDYEITVSPGSMPHNERMYYYGFQQEILGKTIKFKFFPKGIKDKPRFATYQSIRNAEDM
ncbi:DNA ligase [uncultured Caudovirales phage]|uniref:DNA ligase n=1 Tax=uncultured Caudovirales phage TaxID=2100421 RepID=A0A6J5PMX1_9CAUD|nr:DNA ligase [uncultured Caudovirales phage]CAB5226780.1 DNA ligase [uncultured Caudovirales phage]